MTGRRRVERDPGNVMFGSIGWLFADLMLALALAFIVATTVGQPRPPGAAPRPKPSVTATTTVAATTTAAPALELAPVSIALPIDAQRLLAGDPATVAALQQQVQADPRLAGRRAGLVLTFGGTDGYSAVGRGRAIADKVNAVLGGLGADGVLFRDTVYRSFIAPDSSDALTIDVYLFKL